ncbi:MAG: type II CRISPR-associated endonuclease Cas1 [Oscillospiraceae bacterium]
MPYRNLIIENPAEITVKNRQLIVSADIRHSVPIEDICSILLESTRSSVSTAALSALCDNGACVFVCDAKHTPCGVLMPYCAHSRQTAVLQKQMSLSLPRKKRLWQQIVKSKIKNQAECLSLCGKEKQAIALRKMAADVQSGDAGHIEGAAAALYFRALFGADFIRRQDDVQNAALNYGYAILRGFIARQLAAYGFTPCLGIYHCSELNAYNLADDFIEPFRPVIDLFVACNIGAEEKELCPQLKHSLYNLLNVDIAMNNGHYSVSYAIEKCVQSYSACISSEQEILQMPQLLEAKQHCYE